jgi:hypothetical protein
MSNTNMQGVTMPGSTARTAKRPKDEKQTQANVEREAKLDEGLDETFPASDPPSTGGSTSADKD